MEPTSTPKKAQENEFYLLVKLNGNFRLILLSVVKEYRINGSTQIEVFSKILRSFASVQYKLLILVITWRRAQLRINFPRKI